MSVGVKAWVLIDNSIACAACIHNLKLPQRRTVLKAERWNERCTWCGRVIERT